MTHQSTIVNTFFFLKQKHLVTLELILSANSNKEPDLPFGSDSESYD